MRFAVAPVSYLQRIGFQTKDFRKSEDKELALIHTSYLEVLTGDPELNPNVATYDIKDEEFQKLLQERFTPQQEVIEEDIVDESVSEEPVETQVPEPEEQATEE